MVVNCYFGTTYRFQSSSISPANTRPRNASMSDSMFHGPTKINQNIQNAPGGQAVQCETRSAKQTTRERNGANTDLAARVRAGEREREGEIDAASRTSLRSGSGRHPQQGIQLPQVTHVRRFLCIFIAHSRSQTDAHFVSNEYISTRPDSTGHCCSAMPRFMQRAEG
jgi:hypothetical protein